MCKFKKDCKNYDKDSDTCNFCPEIDNNCGKFREFENEK